MRAGFISPDESIVLLQQRGDWNAITGTAEAVGYEFSVPGGLMGPHGVLAIDFLVEFTNNANSKTLRFRAGSLAGQILASSSFPSVQTMSGGVIVRNQASEIIQRCYAGIIGPYQQGAAFPSLGALDTSLDQDYVLTVQNAVGTDWTTLRGMSVMVRKG